MTNLQIAHIAAVSDTGARFDRQMSDEECRDFANVVLLCTAHHRVVDGKDQSDYPVQLLREWKVRREADGQAALAGLRNVTEDRLQELIAEAVQERDSRVENVIARFEELDSEAAGLLRQLLDELAEYRASGPLLDSESVTALNEAAVRLSGLTDNAALLYKAANQLQNLSSDAEVLSAAAKEVRNARGPM